MKAAFLLDDSLLLCILVHLHDSLHTFCSNKCVFFSRIRNYLFCMDLWLCIAVYFTLKMMNTANMYLFIHVLYSAEQFTCYFCSSCSSCKSLGALPAALHYWLRLLKHSFPFFSQWDGFTEANLIDFFTLLLGGFLWSANNASLYRAKC